MHFGRLCTTSSFCMALAHSATRLWARQCSHQNLQVKGHKWPHPSFWMSTKRYVQCSLSSIFEVQIVFKFKWFKWLLKYVGFGGVAKGCVVGFEADPKRTLNQGSTSPLSLGSTLKVGWLLTINPWLACIIYYILNRKKRPNLITI